MDKHSNAIDVVEFRPDLAGEWKQFLAGSSNGTLFHDLDFLAYHAPDRFATRHLLFREDGRLVALLPAAIVDGVLKSPFGASVGGFVLLPALPVATMLNLVAALKEIATRDALAAIELRLNPSAFGREPDEAQSFALAAHGFRLERRWLTMAIPLAGQSDPVLTEQPARARNFRASERKGLTFHEVGPECLEEFYRMLLADREKFGATPTHTLAELRALFDRVPASLRLFVVRNAGELAAGALIFELNDAVAYTFYVCRDPQFEAQRPALFIHVHLARHYAARQFRFLDLGPATFDDFSLNAGLCAFKESLRAKGFCRDTWRWQPA